MVFRNGAFTAPGKAYTLTTTTNAVSVRFGAGILLNGDQIAILTLPPAAPGPQGIQGIPGVQGIPGAGSGGAPAFTETVQNVTTLLVPFAQHLKGAAVAAFCFDSSTPANAVACSYTVDPAGNVAFTWGQPFSGYVEILGSGGAAGIAVETGCATVAGCVALGVATTLDIEPGLGIICVPQLNVATGVFTMQCLADTAILAYRVDPPKASGPCANAATGLTYGAGTWAADGAYFYTCAPAGAVPPISYVWARIPLVTGW
jgi:hypothetical protein